MTRVALLPALLALLALSCGSRQTESDAPAAEDEEIMFPDEREEAAAPAARPAVTQAEAALARGELERAETLLRGAIDEDEADPRAWLDLGLVLELTDREDDAVAAYRRAGEIDPGFAEPHNNLGVLLREAGRLEEAEAALRRAVEARPRFASAHLNLGLTYEELGRGEDAEASYRRVMEIEPREPTSRIQLGLLLLGRGETQEALRVLRPAARGAAGDRALLSALGNGLRRAGDPQMAVRVLTQAVNAEETPPPPPVVAELALAQGAASHPREAVATLEALIETAPDYAIAHFLLGSLLASSRPADARRAFERYLELAPDGPQAARARQQIQRLP